MIEHSIQSFLNKFYVSEKAIPTIPKKEFFVTLPYKKYVIEFKAKFKNLVKRFINTL